MTRVAVLAIVSVRWRKVRRDLFEHRIPRIHDADAAIGHAATQRRRRIGTLDAHRKLLVTESYTDAKGRVADQKAQRAEKKAEKRAEREESGRGLLRGRRDSEAGEHPAPPAEPDG